MSEIVGTIAALVTRRSQSDAMRFCTNEVAPNRAKPHDRNARFGSLARNHDWHR
jgi:hypothetical protein